jgi:hypothetical protein
MKVKIIGLLAALAAMAVLAVVAIGATGAYFSDTKAGTITGTMGDIKITTSGGTVVGGDGINFFWDEMLPGVVYSATINVQNTSSSNSEDLYMVFPNLTALSALNTLGRYGAVQIYVDGSSIYANNNLNDIPNNGTTGLPAQLLLASNVGPTASHVVIFRFEYASAMTKPEPGGVFNLYPRPFDALNHDTRYPAGQEQMVVRTEDLSGNQGLPFQIVATEPGILPGDPGTKPVPLPL